MVNNLLTSCIVVANDAYIGDLYFERAVGFLQELFERWKVQVE